MPTGAITASLLRQLSAHRATLQTLLAQRAGLGMLHAPPGVHAGIAQARAAIAQLKADLRVRGVGVDDEPGDGAGPEDAMPTAGPGSGGQYAQGNQNVQVSGQGNNVTVNYGGAASAPLLNEGPKTTPHAPYSSGPPLLDDLTDQLYTEHAQAGLREITKLIASGSRLIHPDVCAVALLAAGGLAWAVLPVLGGTVTLDANRNWLTRTGSKTLNDWFTEWSNGQGFHRNPDLEAASRMARDLDHAIRDNAALANTALHWLDLFDARNIVFTELAGKGAERERFVQHLRNDLADTSLKHSELRNWTQHLILVTGLQHIRRWRDK